MVEKSVGTASEALFLAIRLMPGQNLTAGLREALVASGAEAMAVVTCAGSLTRVRLRHADRTEATAYSGHFEITSLTGTVGPDGEHLHLGIADGEGRCFGGHLLAEGSEIYTTAEIVVAVLTGVSFRREVCDRTGFRELVIAPRAPGDKA